LNSEILALQQYTKVVDHMTKEQTAESVLDCFKRAVVGELEPLELE
jgi:hypothetical protein